MNSNHLAPEILPARSQPQGEIEFNPAAGLPEWPDMDQAAVQADESRD